MTSNRWFDYDAAIVRDMAQSFIHALMMHKQSICIETATRQKKAYVELLESLLGSPAVSVQADESCPDCVFVEDAVIAVPSSSTDDSSGFVFVTTRPGAEERRGEVAAVKDAIDKVQGQWAVLELPLHHEGERCFLDGGDVLFDGGFLWVGLTSRTNLAAVRALSQILPWLPVLPVAVEDSSGSTLHLKSLTSAIDAKHLLMADNEAGHRLHDAMRKSKEGLEIKEGSEIKVTWVPDQLCANVLRIKGHVVMQEGYPSSQSIIEQLCSELGLTLHTLNMSELAKADGALTCCSVLFKSRK